MTDALALLGGQRPAHLANVGEVDNTDLLGGLPPSAGIPQLSIRGRAFRIIDGDTDTVIKDGEYDRKDITVAIIAARPAKSKRLYEGPWDPAKKNKSPDCFSIDGIAPNPGLENPKAEACADCEFNKWGSGKGKGKACSDYKRVVVVPVNPQTLDLSLNADDEVVGYRLDIPAASLTNFRSYVRELDAHKVPVNAAVTKLTMLESEHPLLAFEFAGYLGEQSFIMASEKAADELVQDAVSTDPVEITKDDDEDTSPAGDPPPLPSEPAPEPVAGESAVADEDEDGDDLDDLPVKDLREIAKGHDIEGWDTRRSPYLREQIRIARASRVGGDDPVAPEPSTVTDEKLEEDAAAVLNGDDKDADDALAGW